MSFVDGPLNFFSVQDIFLRLRLPGRRRFITRNIFSQQSETVHRAGGNFMTTVPKSKTVLQQKHFLPYLYNGLAFWNS